MGSLTILLLISFARSTLGAFIMTCPYNVCAQITADYAYCLNTYIPPGDSFLAGTTIEATNAAFNGDFALCGEAMASSANGYSATLDSAGVCRIFDYSPDPTPADINLSDPKYCAAGEYALYYDGNANFALIPAEGCVSASTPPCPVSSSSSSTSSSSTAKPWYPYHP